VNELDRARGGQVELERDFAYRRLFAAGVPALGARHGVGRGQRQHRPKTLAAREDAVAHRFADQWRTVGR